jgi:hypothetical protein
MDNIKMDLMEIGFDRCGLTWLSIRTDVKLVKIVMILQVSEFLH